MCEGISAELEGIELGDKRLNRRSHLVIEALAADPGASVNAACDGESDTIAAYRLFKNDKVGPDAILRPHLEATKLRMRQHPVVLVLQDTTELDYSSHPPEDMGCLNKEQRRGLYDHTHLAMTPEQLPLGVVGHHQYFRSPESLGKTKERRGLPIEKKESLRWLTGYRLASELNAEMPDTQVISVADSEADIYDIFMEPDRHDASADFLIRAKEERCTPERDLDAGPAVYRKVHAEVRQSELRAQRILELPQTPKRQARKAELGIRARQVTVKPPHARKGAPPVTLNVVLIEEANGPQDGTDVSWLLITTLPIETIEDVLRIVDYYVARWPIEVYFRTLKTGCRVEDIQLETTSRVKNCLAFYKIIAWRVMFLTRLGRECPEMPCGALFDDAEWKSVWKIVTKEDPPRRPPTLGEFMPLLARLGGHNNRKHDAPPGPQAIWVGIRRMTDFALAWLAFGPPEDVSN